MSPGTVAFTRKPSSGPPTLVAVQSEPSRNVAAADETIGWSTSVGVELSSVLSVRAVAADGSCASVYSTSTSAVSVSVTEESPTRIW